MSRSFVLSSLVLLAGCAHHGAPIHVRASSPISLEHVDVHEHPVIVQFEPGDVIPFDVSIDGDLVGAAPGASVPLTVKQPFFLRVDGDDIAVSRDGTFRDRPSRHGSFALGIGVTRQGTRASVRIKTPSR